MSNAARAAAHLTKDIGTACADCPARSRKPRSYQQHKRYFAMLKAVHLHWPESHQRQFADETALRKWAQMKAGHYTTKAVDLYGVPASKAKLILQSAMDNPYSEAVVQGRNLVAFHPVSINYDTMGHADFCALNDAVDAVIRAETGLDPDRVLAETEKAA